MVWSDENVGQQCRSRELRTAVEGAEDPGLSGVEINALYSVGPSKELFLKSVLASEIDFELSGWQSHLDV